MTEAPLISLEDVEVHFEQSRGLFADSAIVRAVDGVSMDIPAESVVVLVGESGCGKTTLGRTVIGVQRPTAGTVRYRGQDIWEAKKGKGKVPFGEIRRSLQMIHQDPGSSLNPNRKVMATLAEPLKRWFSELTREDRGERIHVMLKRAGMTPAGDYADRYPHQLSGGEKQRVALVRAMLMNPDLILADEGISALDVSLRIEMMDLMLELQEEFGTSFLAISHDLSNARYFAEKAGGVIAIMYLGQIVEVGVAEEVIENPQHPYTKALKWATPDLEYGGEAGEMPVRSIDIPEATDPPSGCRFHTRCPEATEYCTQHVPRLYPASDEGDLAGRCFRVDPESEYWESPPLADSGEAEASTASTDGGVDPATPAEKRTATESPDER